MPSRFDIAELRAPVVTDEGFLVVDAYLTRTGIFEYRKGDGGVLRELRLPEEVFKPEVLASFGLKPVTNEHPPGLLDAKNAKQYQVGTVSERVQRDGDMVRAQLCVIDAETIAAMQAGKVEVSCGYRVDLEFTPGTWQGVKYDAVQRNIRGNHVAIVDQGRAGPEVRARLDSADAAIMVGSAAQKGPPNMETVTVAGETFQVPAEMAARIKTMCQAAPAAATADQPQAPQPAAPASPPAAANADAQKLAQLQAKVDHYESAAAKTAREAEIARLRESVAQQTRARVELERTALDVLGSDYKADGKSDAQLQRDVIAKLTPDAKLDGKTDEYIRVRFDMAIEGRRADAGAESLAAARASGTPAPGAKTEALDSAAARQRMIEDNRKAGTAPLAVGRSRSK